MKKTWPSTIQLQAGFWEIGKTNEIKLLFPELSGTLNNFGYTTPET